MESRRPRWGIMITMGSLRALIPVIAALALTITACSQRDTPTAPGYRGTAAPHSPMFSAMLPADDYDICSMDDAFSSCHSWTGLWYSDDYHSCPNGCYTFSFSGVPTWQAKVQRAISLIPATGECGILKQYATSAWNGLRFRYYHNEDGNNADTHPSKLWDSDGQPDNKAMIHIWVGRLQQSDAQVAETIVHEAYHAYFNSGDETAAHGVAVACVPNGWP